jgi:hypothetical protein
MQLLRSLTAEQPIPRVRAETHGAGKPAVEIAKTDRAHETCQIIVHCADGAQVGLAIVQRRNEESPTAKVSM